ncbi:MAG TPA: choline dehydrogenase [Rhizobiales bacterium]|nr:choline dehydrogenase [Hyphomicrobiales bacterium]
MPTALSIPMNTKKYAWQFETEPEPYLDNRRMHCPRGKVLGGSSSINGMVYVRGHACDYEHWQESGADDWGYGDVLPYFKRMENWHEGGHGGDASWRGSDGPLHVSRGPRDNPLISAFETAGEQAGYQRSADYNGERQEGFGPLEATIWKGTRWSTANAYLRPALKTGNCELVSAFAQRIVIEEGKAVGVEVLRRGIVETIHANCEVIVSASAINSPKLLMLSGIGPAKELAGHGIEVVADRAGVGKNLQDHLELYIQQACIEPITLFKYWNIFGKAWVGAQWLFTRTGLGASNQFESGAFIRSAAGVKYPDIQYHFLPIAVRYDGQAVAEGHGFQAHVGPMRSKSRGEVTLKSADPKQAPKIFFNYMSHEDDWSDFRTCIKLTREIFRQEAFDPYRGKEIQPGETVQSNDELDMFIRDHAESAFHPCGTCKMGSRDDFMAVVDPELKVIGIEGLRVADSSIFPRITNGNLNGPSVMVGERAADFILGTKLPVEDTDVWIHPNWQNSQR